MTVEQRASEVQTRDDLRAFLEALRDDLVRNPSSWHNQGLPSFIEAMAAWSHDMDEYYANIGEDVAGVRPWRVIADLLIAARNYEYKGRRSA